MKRLRNDLFARMLAQEVAFYDVTKTGDLISRLTADTSTMANDLTWVFRFSIEAFVRIVGILGYMFFRSPHLAAAVCSVMPVIAVCNKFYGAWLHENAKKIQQALSDSNVVAQEVLSAFRTVASFAQEPWEARRFGDGVHRHYVLNVKQAAADGVYYMGVSTFLMNMCGQLMILGYGSYLCTAKDGDGRPRLEVVQLVAFLSYRGDLQNQFNMLLESFANLVKSSGASAKVFELLDRRPRKTPSAKVRPLKCKGEVELDRVVFNYPSRPGVAVLDCVSLKAAPGTVTALVGHSGAGKSTVFHLLEHFYEPTSGRVLIDGVAVDQLDPPYLHRVVGLVSQEPVLFSGTVRDNILYTMLGRKEFRTLAGDEVPEEVVEAAKAANAHAFISALPDGYGTQVGERGVQLSGGQKQRIAIARAILQDPQILLLDEATSALDAESERVVQEALDRAMRGRTTLVIAHRLSTVVNADRIIVLEKGSIAESGRHEELVRLEDGVYRGLVEGQQFARGAREDRREQRA